MFDEIEKKAKRTNKERLKKKINNATNNSLGALSGHMLDDNYLSSNPDNASGMGLSKEKSDEFDVRMQELHNKGRKRGKRYSYIGISASAAIMIIVITAGYYVYSQIKSMAGKVKEDSTAIIEASIDPDNRCNKDYCCLASLKRMRKNDFLPYNGGSGCPEGYDMNKLECENSLSWCEPGPALRDDCVKEGEKYSLVAGLAGEEDAPVCCLGLAARGVFNVNTGCEAVVGQTICVACPNSECSQGENYCNCPEDCEKIGTSTDVLDERILGGAKEEKIINNSL